MSYWACLLWPPFSLSPFHLLYLVDYRASPSPSDSPAHFLCASPQFDRYFVDRFSVLGCYIENASEMERNRRKVRQQCLIRIRVEDKQSGCCLCDERAREYERAVKKTRGNRDISDACGASQNANSLTANPGMVHIWLTLTKNGFAFKSPIFEANV